MILLGLVCLTGQHHPLENLGVLALQVHACVPAADGLHQVPGA